VIATAPARVSTGGFGPSRRREQEQSGGPAQTGGSPAAAWILGERSQRPAFSHCSPARRNLERFSLNRPTLFTYSRVSHHQPLVLSVITDNESVHSFINFNTIR